MQSCRVGLRVWGLGLGVWVLGFFGGKPVAKSCWGFSGEGPGLMKFICHMPRDEGPPYYTTVVQGLITCLRDPYTPI